MLTAPQKLSPARLGRALPASQVKYGSALQCTVLYCAVRWARPGYLSRYCCDPARTGLGLCEPMPRSQSHESHSGDQGTENSRKLPSILRDGYFTSFLNIHNTKSFYQWPFIIICPDKSSDRQIRMYFAPPGTASQIRIRCLDAGWRISDLTRGR